MFDQKLGERGKKAYFHFFQLPPSMPLGYDFKIPQTKNAKNGLKIGSIITSSCLHIKFVDYVHYDHP
jgi:hypothetical protein